MDPTIDDLVVRLPHLDNLQAVLTSRALAEQGAAAVPALHAALAALPVPADPDSPDWWAGETAKNRIMKALQWLGPAAEPAVPLLVALVEDEHGYRDTRHQAMVTLQAIGRPAAAAVVARIRPGLATTPSADDDVLSELYALVRVLSVMPPDALRELPDLPAMVPSLRRHPDLSGLADLIGEHIALGPVGE